MPMHFNALNALRAEIYLVLNYTVWHYEQDLFVLFVMFKI